jgi:hypothetical protein
MEEVPMSGDATTTGEPEEPGRTLAEGAAGGRALLDRACDGDADSQAALIRFMDRPELNPDLCRKIVNLFGDLRHYAESSVIERVAGDNEMVRKAIQMKVNRLIAELAGPDPTPIERLLAERAAFCWLVTWRYETRLAQATDLTSKREEFHHRRIDAAHRRYLSSLKTLAQVRKLALPAVQVNIGENQVNVAGH